VQALLGALGDLPVPLLERVVRSVSQLRMSEATLVLTRAMSLARGLEPVVLEELSRRTCIVGDETRRECAALARGFLDNREPKLRRHAAMAVGRLGDSASFEPLLGLLDDEDAGVRRVALLALQQLTGVQRSWPRARWSAWWSAESRWIDAASARHMQTLRDGTAFDARAALQELEEHPVFAFRVARLASNALQHADVHIRAAACETLARACAAHAIEHLIPALDDPHPVVRAAALAGLRQVTSTDQGKDARAWAAWWATVD
jgi:HEAT repeat protein